MTDLLITLIAGFLIILGTAGSILPFLPGLPLVLVGLWGYAAYTHFNVVTLWPAIIFTVLAVVVEVLNILAPSIGAAGTKSSRFGAIGATVGAIIGIMTLGPIGIVVGPFVGAWVGEMLNQSGPENAFRSARGAVIGVLLGSFFKLLLGTTIFIYFLIVTVRH
jgi:uncharacterized protein YqgC (DUF456 family)